MGLSGGWRVWPEVVRTTKEVMLSSLNSPLGEWAVVIPQSMVDKVLKEHVHEIIEEPPFEERLLDQDIPLFEEEAPSRGFGSLLLVGAIVASLLVFTGLQVADSHAPATQNEVAVSSGVQSMSAAELIQAVKAENRAVYWISPKRGDTYTNSSSTDGIDQISYRQEGSNVSNLNQFDVTVSTYKDLSTYQTQPHQFFGANSRTVTLNSGVVVTYNATLPNQTIVIFPGRPEVVVLNYPAVQAVPTLLNDAQNLVPIR